jgi:NAD(P)-dependent dehydrogenase (short-subunit alcohol dehydrogenase family)
MAALKKNVFLTGASAGIGLATARILSQNDYAVWGTTRDVKKIAAGAPFHPIEMRLEDVASVETAWNEALAQAGQFDIVIQNAGAGIFGSIEEVKIEDARRQWQVLVEGPLQLLKLAAAHLRPRREGLIIGVSSLAAELPMPFSCHYSAGKAAFSALLAGLSMELQPFQVNVVDLRPGDILTSFNDHLPKTIPADSPYLPWLTQGWEETARLMKNAPGPDLIARAILKIVNARPAPALVRSGTFFQATLSPFGARFLPHRWLLDSIRSYYKLNQVDAKN